MQELHRVFKDFATSSPAKRGQDLMTVFTNIEPRRGNFIGEAYATVLEVLDLPADHPMARAGMGIADLIDSVHAKENYGGHGNGYHNRNHMFEVMTAAAALIKLHDERGYEPKLNAEDKLILVTAAMTHDLGHNGKGNGMGADRVPLLTEQRAIDLAKPIIRSRYGKAHADAFEKDFARFEAILVATDIGGGPLSPGKFFADYAKFHAGELDAPPVAPIPQLERFAALLKDDPVLSQSCILMQDADLLPSIGLTTDWAENQDLRLNEEFTGNANQADIDFQSTLYFYDHIAALHSRAGQEFQGNFDAIKEHTRQLQVFFAECKLAAG